MTHEDQQALLFVPDGWFNLPGDHPICVHLRKRKFVKGYRHQTINQWSMILKPAYQNIRRQLLSTA